jgi:8-oxo-dGTP diphosphatase
MNNMVVGFLFSPDKKEVVLIEKNKPDWQKGKLNGIGGHKEDEEDLSKCMTREFIEETGVIIEDWKLFAKGFAIDSDASVYFYKAFNKLYENVKSTTNEKVVIIPLDMLNTIPLIYNLSWLIPLALDENTVMSEFGFTLPNK